MALIEEQDITRSADCIDTHAHLVKGIGSRLRFPGMRAGAASCLDMMNQLGVTKTLALPPPFPPGHSRIYDVDDFVDIAKEHSDSFAFLGGGGTLNPMVQKAAHNEDVGSKVQSMFEKKALEILSKGAVGFGELTAEHFSLEPNHPYESTPPDHPLFLLLSDIAADNDVPIDLHMEAVCEKMQTPMELRLPPNPDIFYPNINSFERLLDHNPKAKIIWAHAGWDNTGYRTAALCGELLKKHPNLYMSIKFGRRGRPENRMIGQQNQIKPEWLQVISTFSERFLIGSDQFYFPLEARERTCYNVEVAVMFLSLLPLELSRKVGHENASRIFGLMNKTE